MLTKQLGWNLTPHTDNFSLVKDTSEHKYNLIITSHPTIQEMFYWFTTKIISFSMLVLKASEYLHAAFKLNKE